MFSVGAALRPRLPARAPPLRLPCGDLPWASSSGSRRGRDALLFVVDQG